MSAKQEGIKACLAKALDRMLYETTRMFAIEGARRVTVTGIQQQQLSTKTKGMGTFIFIFPRTVKHL
jgi:hypothetical protein